MDYKRIEIYVGWTCNQKCSYCMEYPNMKRQWSKKVTNLEILKYLIKYKKEGYNHVTFLGGEPFIQRVFLEALRIGKKLGYTILVTTNATTLHLDKEAQKYLPFIDELILSFQAIDKDLQQKISRTNTFVRWEEVFENTKKYWNGKFLKINIVITKDNLKQLFDIVKYVIGKGVKNIAITYPDLDIDYYGKQHLLDYVAPTYTDAIEYIIEIDNYCDKNKINLKIVDFPFCIFPKEKRENYIKKTDEIDFGNRIKVGTSLFEKNEPARQVIDRKEVLPRERTSIDKCKDCKYNNLCWGPSINYKHLYGYSEIKTINNEKI